MKVEKSNKMTMFVDNKTRWQALGPSRTRIVWCVLKRSVRYIVGTYHERKPMVTPSRRYAQQPKGNRRCWMGNIMIDFGESRRGTKKGCGCDEPR